MSITEAQPSRRARWAAQAVTSMQRAGLDNLASSRTLRWLGKRLLLSTAEYPVTRTVISGLGRGLKLRLLPNTPQSYYLGTHELSMQRVIREEIRTGMTVYDCGANIGFFSAIFASLVGPAGRVFAFEPSHESLTSLRAVADLNGFAHLTVVPEAVWDRKELLRFARGSGDESLVTDHIENVFGETTKPHSIIEISATSLDDFVYLEGNPAPDFIKIDVEGSEGKAIAGARRLLSERRPRLLLEIHGLPGLEVWAILKEMNYTFINIATGRSPGSAEEFATWITQYLAEPVARY